MTLRWLCKKMPMCWTVYQRSLRPMTTRTTITTITKIPAKDIHRLSLRHHLALSYRDSSMGPYRRVYSLELLLVSSRLLVLWSPSCMLFTGLAGRGKKAPIIQAKGNRNPTINITICTFRLPNIPPSVDQFTEGGSQTLRRVARLSSRKCGDHTLDRLHVLNPRLVGDDSRAISA